jgi:hypothetical protein
MKYFYSFTLASLLVLLFTSEESKAQCFATTTQQNVTCNGACDGSATATVFIGGFGAHSYSWNTVPVQTTQTATGLCAGTYVCTIVASNGCQTSATVTITEPAPLNATITKTDVSCFEGNDGTATITVSGLAGYTYSWSTTPVQTTQTATGLTAGTYTVTATNTITGCSVTESVTIGQPEQITGDVQITPADCGLSNGEISLIASGGTGELTYSWDTEPEQTTATATGLSAGTYTVTVTDENGCTQTGVIVVSNTGGPELDASSSNVSCSGGNDGTAAVTVTGGTSPFDYSWNTDPVQTTQTASGLEAGTYTVTVTDALGCTATESVVVLEQPAFVVNASITDVICHGGATGSANASGSGGTAPYTFVWTTEPPQTTGTISGLVAGLYTVVGTDNNGCTATATVTIAEPEPLVVSISQTDITCNGDANASAQAEVSGGTEPYQFLWSTGSGNTSESVSGLSGGDYTVTVTDSEGCTESATVSINEPSALALSVSSTSTQCGEATGTATVDVTGGSGEFTYEWGTDPVQNTQTATALGAGNYTVTVTDGNGCSETDVATVTAPGGPSSTVSHTNVSCNGGTNGTATVNASGGTPGYTYLWSPGNADTQTAFGLSAGSYTVTVTDEAGCTTTSTVTITQPNAIDIAIDKQDAPCEGDALGSVNASVSGGVPNYSYFWDTEPVQTTAGISGLTAGDYTLTVTDANGCTASETVSISEPEELTASVVQTHVSCAGGSNGSATVTPTGGTQPYTYSWNSNPAQSTATAINLISGTYTVIVTDANGCTVTGQSIVNEPAAIVVTVTTTDEDCGLVNGTAIAVASGGVGTLSYSWNTSPAQTDATATGLAAGNYTVTVSDQNGCSVTAQGAVQNVGGLSAVATGTDLSCNGSANGTVTITATGGTEPYSYSWDTEPEQTTQSVTGLAAGTYTGTVTDDAGCVYSATVTITQPTPFTVSVTGTDILCHGQSTGSATATAAGGTQQYSYAWNTNPVQTTAAISSLSAGNYTVVATDANGCTASATVNISQPESPLSATTIQTQVSCPGGSNGAATVNPSGGTPSYSYSWSTVPAQTTQTAFGLSAGSYTVVVTDENGCTVSRNATINQPAPIVIALNVTDASCGAADGEIQATVTGGTGDYTYAWATSPVQTTSTAAGLVSGSYTVTVTDANGCTQTSSASIANDGSAELTISGSNLSCFGSDNGTAMVNATGGTGELSYSWDTDPVQTTQSITGLAPGTYTVTVTDEAGCVSFASVTILEPAPLAITVSGTDPTCADCNDGEATATVTGGTPAYSYLWSNMANTPTVTDLGEGEHCVTVTDGNGCSTTACTTLTALVTGITDASDLSLAIYPNPTNESITVEMTHIDDAVLIRMFDIVGNMVMDANRNTQGPYRETFDVSAIPAGVYMLTIETRDRRMVRKVVKQ